MKFALFAAIIALLPVAQESETFTDAKLGLSFTYPKSWTKAAPAAPAPKTKKKGKKPAKTEELGQTFLIPIEGSADPAELFVMRTSFSGAPEDWTQLQEATNKIQKREIVRQWQQDILGVPMLLTRINYSDLAGARTTLAGLFYTHSNEKLLFRLTANAGDFDKAQFEFTKAMESLHTVSGELPKEQVPGQEIVPDAPKKKVNPREVVHALPEVTAGSSKHVKVGKKTPVQVGSSTVAFILPSGWVASSVSGSDGPAISLASPKLKWTVIARLKPVGQSDRPEIALQAASTARLAEYDIVQLREDQPTKPNRSGCEMSWITRVGKSTSGGALSTLDAYVLSGNYYLLISGISKEPLENDAELKVVRGLLDQLRFEIGS